MKAISMRNVLRVAVVVAAMQAGNGAAHDDIGQLGGKTSATDVWEVTCSGGSDFLAMRVKDGLPKKAPKVSIQVSKDRLAANTTDPIDGDNEYSPEIRVNAGDGVYLVTVDKTGKAPENYLLEYHCENNAGGHTSTTIAPFQNQ